MRELRSARLVLEPQVETHAQEMFDVLSDPAIYEFEGEPPHSVAWLRERYRKLESRVSPDGSQRWLNWVVRAQGVPIGYVQATVFHDGRAAIAYVLASRWWGRGYASEAVAAMLDELRDRYAVRLALAVFKAANSRSRALLERAGFVDTRGETEPDERIMQRRLA